MKYNEDDEFLFDMVSESNEDVRNTLYENYEPLIKYIVKQYAKAASKYGVDYADLLQEANVGFANALNNYDEKKESSLKTFISLCIKRRLINAIRKAQTNKNQMELSNLSLDYDYVTTGMQLKDIIKDENSDPLIQFSDLENEEMLIKNIKKRLSAKENEVFDLLLKGFNYKEISLTLDKSEKQIDNTIQRIRGKVRNLLKEE